MSFTKLEEKTHAIFEEAEYVPSDVVYELGQALSEEDNEVTLSLILHKFERFECPRCGDEGAFRWHFLGELTHPECGWTGYVSFGHYLKRQVVSSWRVGTDLGGGMISGNDQNDMTTVILGLFFFLMGTMIGMCMRLPFAILGLPIHLIAKQRHASEHAVEEAMLASGTHEEPASSQASTKV